MKKTLTLLAAVLTLAACGEQSIPAPASSASAPVQATGGGGVDGTSALLGGALGFMAGSALSSRPAAPAPVVHQTTVVQKKVVVVNRPTQTVSRPAARTYSAPSRSFSSGRR